MAVSVSSRSRQYTSGVQKRSGTGALYNKSKAGGLVIDTADSYKLKYNRNGTIVALDGGQAVLAVLTTNGAISPSTSAKYMITKAGVYAGTLAAPTTVTHDGVEIEINSATANAHTITATGLLQTGSAAVNVATFNATAGASLTLRAYAAKWYVIAANGVSFS